MFALCFLFIQIQPYVSRRRYFEVRLEFGYSKRLAIRISFICCSMRGLSSRIPAAFRKKPQLLARRFYCSVRKRKDRKRWQQAQSSSLETHLTHCGSPSKI